MAAEKGTVALPTIAATDSTKVGGHVVAHRGCDDPGAPPPASTVASTPTTTTRAQTGGNRNPRRPTIPATST
eukprot:CAMPEP_0201121260 /NCGR_PEP_ID=MMETSP0850-20130426/5169_1 /ASSEMBLY_ACC=CAM_ASM_000622 /TAXON_ID=183588 /ORGANISM="Pseudo-nitzschia fraudulenta, Strain WWA7" /LENGTH=71 /DNA_ID=CAMNT_0047387653 /DNA_START=304 /DNA_END=519 /DNA_ORIENTATION=-